MRRASRLLCSRWRITAHCSSSTAARCIPHCSTFRDFPAEHLLPASEGSATGGPDVASSSGAFELNAWQVRHATLVVLALKEVNELRFVLCPK